MATLKMTASERKKIERWAKKARKWLESEEGRKAIKEALLEAKKVSDKFREASRIDPKSLHEPMTI